MPFVGSVEKQPAEKWPVDISYATWLGTRTADSISVSVTAPSGMVLDYTAATSDTVQVGVSGGTAGQSYTWTVTTTIVIGGRNHVLEDEFTVSVVESTVDTTKIADAVATAAGADAPTIVKRTADARRYTIDVGPLLRPREQVTAIASLAPDSDLAATPGQITSGRYVDAVISGGTVPNGQPYKDFSLRASITTTSGTVQVNVTFRVYP